MNLTEYEKYFNNITKNLNLPNNNPCFDEITKSHDINCIYKTVCNQFSDYFVNTGLFLIISYYVIQFTMRWFLNKGYKLLKPSKLKTKLENVEYRYYILTWVTDKQIFCFVIYILVLISLVYLKR